MPASQPRTKKRVALIGGGPSALFVYKRLVQSGRSDLRIDIFESKSRLGQGMPYSHEGANHEHITNVSGNELPELVVPLKDWVRSQPDEVLDEHGLDRHSFDDERVLPRLLFGRYLEAQFELLRAKAQRLELETVVHFQSPVTDIRYLPERQMMEVEVAGQELYAFDRVVICTGHNWPKQKEGEVPGYYESPYPPSKLARSFNHTVALRGSSLTAVDALRTLARHNGRFVRQTPHSLAFEPAVGSENFKVVMHTRSGLLPCLRIHLEDPQVSADGLLQQHDFQQARQANEGFVPLDLVFEEDFKKLLRESDPALYDLVRSMTLEQFVEAAMRRRENADPFSFFREEYAEALESLAERESIHWKEALAILSFALNYPAKHFCAEDMLRLRNDLMPLISIVIAFLPHSSCQELIALHESGRLQLLSVGSDSEVEVTEQGEIVYRFTDEDGSRQARIYQTYIDCVGQPHLPVKALPFPTLIEQGVVVQARVAFRDKERGLREHEKDSESVQRDPDGSYHLVVPGIAINDSFQPVAKDGQANSRLHIMAVPYIGGHNPDYSGLDFCEEASRLIVDAMLAEADLDSLPSGALAGANSSRVREPWAPTNCT